MIKVTYFTHSKKAQKPEKTTIRIFEGKYFAQYDVAGKAEATVKKMKEDGYKNVLYSRGQMIQLFSGKTEEEVLEIVQNDIKNGLLVAEDKTKDKLEIKDLVIERK